MSEYQYASEHLRADFVVAGRPNPVATDPNAVAVRFGPNLRKARALR
jgi:hypothetical protein